jgi:hypothetical protein
MLEYDIILFGVTGFTGKLALEYLLEKNYPGLRFGCCARNEAKAQQVVDAVCQQLAGRTGKPVEAVKALAVGELLVQVTGLRRSRTAPDSLASMPADAVCRSRRQARAHGDAGAGDDGTAAVRLAPFGARVPVHTSRGTRVQSRWLVRAAGASALDDDTAAPAAEALAPETVEPVSPRELIRSPPAAHEDTGAAGGAASGAADHAGGGGGGGSGSGVAGGVRRHRRSVPPALALNALMPVSWALMTEPARDRRYRLTSSVATVAELLLDSELPVAAAPAAARSATVPPSSRPRPPVGSIARGRAAAAALAQLFVPDSAQDFIVASLPFPPHRQKHDGQCR